MLKHHSKLSDLSDKINLYLLRNENKMSELLINLFEGVIDEKAIDKLSKEELDAINKMLTEAGY